MLVLLVLPLVTSAAQNKPGDTALTTNGVYNSLGQIVNYLIYIGALIAVLYIVFAGFKYLFAAGNSEEAGKARTMLFHGLIGLLIIVGAYVIVNTVQTVVGQWLGVNIQQ